jgi:hypothetical protein
VEVPARQAGVLIRGIRSLMRKKRDGLDFQFKKWLFLIKIGKKSLFFRKKPLKFTFFDGIFHLNNRT